MDPLVDDSVTEAVAITPLAIMLVFMPLVRQITAPLIALHESVLLAEVRADPGVRTIPAMSLGL